MKGRPRLQDQVWPVLCGGVRTCWWRRGRPQPSQLGASPLALALATTHPSRALGDAACRHDDRSGRPRYWCRPSCGSSTTASGTSARRLWLARCCTRPFRSCTCPTTSSGTRVGGGLAGWGWGLGGQGGAKRRKFRQRQPGAVTAHAWHVCMCVCVRACVCVCVCARALKMCVCVC